MERKTWFYKGCCIQPADPNSAGIRWTTLCFGERLRADTKEGMRQLISQNSGQLCIRRPGPKAKNKT